MSVVSKSVDKLKFWSEESEHANVSIDDLDDETMKEVTGMLEMRGEELTQENIEKQAQFYLEAQEMSEEELRIGVLQDEQDQTISDQELIAPEQLIEESSWREMGHLKRGGDYVRILTITGYPSVLPPGVLNSLYTSDMNVRLAQHIDPVDEGSILKILKRKLNRLGARLMRKKAKQKFDTQDEQEKLERVEELVEGLIQGKTKLYDHTVFIGIIAPTKDLLDESTGIVINELAKLEIDVSPQKKMHADAQQALSPVGEDPIKASAQLMEGKSLPAFFPFIEPELHDPEGLFFGDDIHGKPIMFEPYNLPSYISCGLGATGAGKTFQRMHETYQRYIRNQDHQTYVLDPKANFSALAEQFPEKSQVIRFGGDTIINPLDLHASFVHSEVDVYQNNKRLIMSIYDQLFGDELTMDHSGVLRRVIDIAYLTHGITPDPRTHDKQPPTFEDHREILHGIMNGEDPVEFLEFADTAGGEHVSREALAQRIHEISNRMTSHDPDIAKSLYNGMEVFSEGSEASNLNGQTNVDLDAPFIVFDMEAFADSQQAPLMMHVVFDLIYRRCQSTKDPDEVIFDEIHYLMEIEEAISALELFCRHHRHSQTRIDMLTQTADEFLDGQSFPKRRRQIYKLADFRRLFAHDNVSDEMIDYHDLSRSEIEFIETARRGENAESSQYLLQLTGHGKRQVTFDISENQFEIELIDEDGDPWQYLKEEEKLSPDVLEYLHSRGQLKQYAPYQPTLVEQSNLPDGVKHELLYGQAGDGASEAT